MNDGKARQRGQWLALSMLAGAGFVNYLDRTSLAIAANSIRAEMHLSASDLGALLAAFSVAYGLAQLPIGPLLDRFGSLRVLGMGLGTWSAAQMLTAIVPGLRTFLVMRVALGIGEAPYFPAGIKVIREYFPKELRGRGIGVVNGSTAVAQGIAPPLLTAIMLALGWRSMFAVIGGVGLALALLWRAAARRVGAPQKDVQDETKISWTTWSGLFRQRLTWGLMLGFGGINYTAWFYIGWLPTYLQARGISVAKTGWVASIPFFAGSAGMYTSGWLADLRARRGESLLRIYLSQIVVGMLLSAGSTLVIARVASLPGAILCVSGALFWVHFAGTAAWGYVAAAIEPGLVATVCSIQNCGSYLIASLAPLFTGWLLDRTHTFESAFALCAAAGLAGAGVYLFVVRGAQVRG